MTAPDFLRLGPGDERLLLDVAEDVFDFDLEPARLDDFLNDANHVLIVARLGGRVIGQIAAVLHRHFDAPPDLYIDNLGVTPEHRRQGVATRLVDLALGVGRDLGCTGTWVVTEIENDAAAALYSRTGAVRQSVAMFSYPADD